MEKEGPTQNQTFGLLTTTIEHASTEPVETDASRITSRRVRDLQYIQGIRTTLRMAETQQTIELNHGYDHQISNVQHKLRTMLLMKALPQTARP